MPRSTTKKSVRPPVGGSRRAPSGGYNQAATAAASKRKKKIQKKRHQQSDDSFDDVAPGVLTSQPARRDTTYLETPRLGADDDADKARMQTDESDSDDDDGGGGKQWAPPSVGEADDEGDDDDDVAKPKDKKKDVPPQDLVLQVSGSWKRTQVDIHPFITIAAVVIFGVLFGIAYDAAVSSLVAETNECNLFRTCPLGSKCVEGFCVQDEVETWELDFVGGVAPDLSLNYVAASVKVDRDVFTNVNVRVAGGSSLEFDKRQYRLRFDGLIPGGYSRCMSLRAEVNDYSYMRNYLSHKLFMRFSTIPVPLVRYVHVVGDFSATGGETPTDRLYLAVQCNDEQWLATFHLDAMSATYKYEPSGDLTRGIVAEGNAWCAYTPQPDAPSNYTLGDILLPSSGYTQPVGTDDPGIKAFVADCVMKDYRRYETPDSAASWFTQSSTAWSMTSAALISADFTITTLAAMSSVKFYASIPASSNIVVQYNGGKNYAGLDYGSNIGAGETTFAAWKFIPQGGATTGAYKVTITGTYKSPITGKSYSHQYQQWLLVDGAAEPASGLVNPTMTYEEGVVEARKEWRTECMREEFAMAEFIDYMSMRIALTNIDDAYKNHMISLQDGKYHIYPNDWDLTWGCVYSEAHGVLCEDVVTDTSITNDANLHAVGSRNTWPCLRKHNMLMSLTMADPEAKSCVAERVCGLTHGEVWNDGIPALIDHMRDMLEPHVAKDDADMTDVQKWHTAIDEIKQYQIDRAAFLDTEFGCGAPQAVECGLKPEPSRTIGGYVIASIVFGVIAIALNVYLVMVKPSEKAARIVLLMWSMTIWYVVIESIVALFFSGSEEGTETDVGVANPSHSGAAAKTTTNTIFKQTMSKEAFEKVMFLITLYVCTLQVPLWCRQGFGAFSRYVDQLRSKPKKSSVELATMSSQIGLMANDAAKSSKQTSMQSSKKRAKQQAKQARYSEDAADTEDVEVVVKDTPAATKSVEDNIVLSKKAAHSVHMLILSVIIFYWLLVLAYVLYIFFAPSGKQQQEDFTLPSMIVAIISLMAMILVRAFWAALKWAWLWKLGMSLHDMDVAYSARREGTWNMAHYLEAYPSRRIRVADGYPKKIVHMFDGILSFLGSMLAAGTVSKFNVNAAFAFGAILSIAQMVVYLLTYQSQGVVGWLMYGAKARIMDGSLGRANELFGWLTDKLMLPVLVPLSIWMTSYYRGTELFLSAVTIFGPIIIGDAFGEFIGASYGKHDIKVCGIGETNRKSKEGTAAVFISSLVTLLIAYPPMSASYDWYILAPFSAAIGTVTELYAPRSTDNVFMAVVGVIVLGIFGEITSR